MLCKTTQSINIGIVQGAYILYICFVVIFSLVALYIRCYEVIWRIKYLVLYIIEWLIDVRSS
jgi:hypothetical protein